MLSPKLEMKLLTLKASRFILELVLIGSTLYCMWRFVETAEPNRMPVCDLEPKDQRLQTVALEIEAAGIFGLVSSQDIYVAVNGERKKMKFQLPKMGDKDIL